MKPIPTQTLSGLLRMHDTAIADLQAMRDPAVARLISRLELHRNDVVAALRPSNAAGDRAVGGSSVNASIN